MLDLKIIHGRIIDGSGRPAYAGDVGVIHDKIVTIGDLRDQESVETIDAAGNIVAPGFIDMHTHSDLSFKYDRRASSKLYSGVTTEVIGNCGICVAPVREENRQLLIDYLGTRLIGSIPVNLELPWTSFKEYLNWFDDNPPSINLAPLLGQGVVRIAVMGFAKGMPTAAELKDMQQITDIAMSEGALGLSSGLVYLPGEYSSKEEIAELCKVMIPYQGIYCTHMRTESDGIMDAIDEALWIGGTAKVPVHISHLKLLSQNMLGKTDLVLERMAQAERSGIEVTYDIYPYTAGLTSLSACLPPWIFEGGVAKMIERLQDQSIRSRIRKEIAEGLPNWQNFVKSAGGWEKFFVSSVRSEENKHLEGKFITEIGELQGKDPYDAAFDLLIAENGRVQMNYYAMLEEDVMTFLRQPRAMIGSDAMSLSAEGILSFGKPHPRAFGTPTRFLGRYVREKKILSFEEAVKKMTGLPATRLGIKARGFIKENYYADIVIFNPDTVQDLATYAEPKQYSQGIEAVIVNGQVIVEKGAHNEVYAGCVLGRSL
ncbi:N-acyl-D-amino-acid deacylase [Sporomusaceae bacterium BoRhaA]|uniref:N-acyl-D-amino-acid deacylase family protein n=1 Tax=Pelorhabdus rhamnosifermentans TaxID=2772457 RepID=UPI001C0629AA|nr:D-aminoacylase [Pelorhabdus rhamnosifermentans]MBU2702166.1 N-acyl-D-amino-acid deacylase [Pelorhabdus rhamnosifermentans]